MFLHLFFKAGLQTWQEVTSSGFLSAHTIKGYLQLIVLGFNDTSTLEGHFVSSSREREKRDRRESRGDEREGQGRKRNRNESEETEEIKTFPLYPYPLQGQQALPNCKPVSVGRPSDVRYTAPSHHPTTPRISTNPASSNWRFLCTPNFQSILNKLLRIESQGL